jgi:hypothetical protein
MVLSADSFFHFVWLFLVRINMKGDLLIKGAPAWIVLGAPTANKGGAHVLSETSSFQLLDFAPAQESMFFLKRRYFNIFDFAPALGFLLVRSCVL